jgi:ubiquinone/menaquinone biosynthesis C-methylase UbiE
VQPHAATLDIGQSVRVPVEGLGRAPGANYDAIASDYDTEVSDNAFNALYERPASLALLPRLSGAHVLDAGCGSGRHAAEMVRRGATVLGIDTSAELLRLARQRCPEGTEFRVANVADPLSFLADASFDVVLSALMLHYIRDWGPVLGEFKRILRRDGVAVISTHHPAMDVELSGTRDYFATELLSDQWTFNGRIFDVEFWRRPLTDMVAAMQRAGFRIDRLVEPMPLPECEQRFPYEWTLLTTKPRFVFFRLIAVAGTASADSPRDT